MSIEDVKAVYATLKAEACKTIVGQEDVVEQLVVALLTGGHVLLEGVPGTAKTLMAKTLAYLVRVEDMWVYTSRGVWASWPVRFNSPAEVSSIELSSQEFKPNYRNPWTVLRSPVPGVRRHVSR